VDERVDDIWEARPPQQLFVAVFLVAGLATLDAFALGHVVTSGQRSPQAAGALGIALACGQVAVATIFLTLGEVGFARKGLLLALAVAYGGGLVSAGATKPIRWDAACGELFVLAGLFAVPGAVLRLVGVRLVHRSIHVKLAHKPWQFTLEGSLALLTATACLFAAIRWLTASTTSGVGVIAEWLLLAGLPWICCALVFLPLHPLASLVGLWLVIGAVAGCAMPVASFLNRPAMGLTTSAEVVVCAALLFALRWAGYRVELASRIAAGGPSQT
jgi:hypothetical protein